MSFGNMRHILKLALQHPQAVKSITESGDPPDAGTGVTGPFKAEGAMGPPFPVTIEWRTPYACRDKSPVSLAIKCGVELAEMCIIGMPALDNIGPAVLDLHGGTLMCPNLDVAALPLQRRNPTAREQYL